ncbi:MAG: DNA alkylation repair protein [Bacteroidales bacterium]|nr:DNA alkylation repair protein [Bacteroidales bacterium]
MEDYVNMLIQEFERNADPLNAKGQKAYMKNQFDFLGIKAPIRQNIQKPFLVQTYLPAKTQLNTLVKKLWNQPYREYQYFGQELTLKYFKTFEKQDIKLLEFMITHKSWWDTTDFIAAKPVGSYLKIYPEERKTLTEKWLKSGNIWLQRTAILFQLKYKKDTDTELLSHVINSLTGSKEFFINKAIGWVLREYGKTNPQWVVEFTTKTNLGKLSSKEALRRINY